MIKRTKLLFSIFLYCLLSICIVQSLIIRHSRERSFSIELLNHLLSSSSKADLIEIHSPRFSLLAKDRKIFSSFIYDEETIEMTGEGVWDKNRLDIQLTASGSCAPLLKPFHPQSLFLTGQYALNSRIKGPWNSLEISSSLAISKGSLDVLSTGAHLQHVEATLFSDGKTVTLQNFKAQDANKGAIEASGILELQKNFPFSIQIEASHAALIMLKHVKGIFSGRCHLKGSLDNIELEGQLKADSLSLALNENKPTPKTLDISYINHDGVLPQLPKKKKAPHIELNISVSASDNIWITDEHLKSEWKTELELKGTTISPLVYGKLEMIEGDYIIAGKNVLIKEGLILFNGDPVKNASLSVLGALDTNAIIAEILLSGPLANPNLTLRANPPMAQADILSHLIFGCALGDITPQQSKQLKKSLKEIALMNSEPNVLEGIRDRFGIDRIEFNRGSGSALEDVSVQVGKYLTRGFYIAFNKGITSDSNGIVLEASLQSNLKLQAQINDDAEGQLHLKWRHDY